jgi:hypothetical protein
VDAEFDESIFVSVTLLLQPPQLGVLQCVCVCDVKAVFRQVGPVENLAENVDTYANCLRIEDTCSTSLVQRLRMEFINFQVDSP